MFGFGGFTARRARSGRGDGAGYGTGADLSRLFWRGIWEHAIVRWESATLLALAMLSAAVGSIAAAIGILPAWAWPIVPLLCLAGEGALVWASLHDREGHREVVSRLLHDTFRPQQLTDPELSRQVLAALALRARIESLIRNTEAFGQHPDRANLALQFDGWIGVLCRLASQLDRLKSEFGFSDSQARGTATRARQLEQLAAAEEDSTTFQEMEATIAGHGALLDNLYQVRKTVERADLRLERSVSQLATVHAQVILMGARGLQGEPVNALCAEIAAEISNLRAMANAVDRVHGESAEIVEFARSESRAEVKPDISA